VLRVSELARDYLKIESKAKKYEDEMIEVLDNLE
jgi:hypothetical protein